MADSFEKRQREKRKQEKLREKAIRKLERQALKDAINAGETTWEEGLEGAEEQGEGKEGEAGKDSPEGFR